MIYTMKNNDKLDAEKNLKLFLCESSCEMDENRN
jgi:hypothetical protein